MGKIFISVLVLILAIMAIGCGTGNKVSLSPSAASAQEGVVQAPVVLNKMGMGLDSGEEIPSASPTVSPSPSPTSTPTVIPMPTATVVPPSTPTATFSPTPAPTATPTVVAESIKTAGPPTGIDPSLWEFAVQASQAFNNGDSSFFVKNLLVKDRDCKQGDHRKPVQCNQNPNQKIKSVLLINGTFASALEIGDKTAPGSYAENIQRAFNCAKPDGKDAIGSGGFQIHGIANQSVLTVTFICYDDAVYQKSVRDLMQFFLKKEGNKWLIYGWTRAFGNAVSVPDFGTGILEKWDAGGNGVSGAISGNYLNNKKDIAAVLQYWESLSDYVKWPLFH